MVFRILLCFILVVPPIFASTADCIAAAAKAGTTDLTENSLEMRKTKFSVTIRDSVAIATDAGLPRDWINLEKIKMAKARVLDFGCGWGGLVIQMRGLEIEAYGVDFKMHEGYLNNPKYKDWFTRQDVTEKTSYPENHFDIIYSTFSLFSYPAVTHVQRVGSLKEMARVLIDGGRIHIAPFSQVEKMKEYLSEVPELEIVGLDNGISGKPAAIELRRKPR